MMDDDEIERLRSLGLTEEAIREEAKRRAGHDPETGTGGTEKPEASDIAELLDRLARLHDQGILTDDEYQQKRNELEGRLQGPPAADLPELLNGLARLRDAGVLTDDEYEQKRSQLEAARRGPPALAPAEPPRPLPGGYPIWYDVPYPEKLGRLSTAFRAILAIPQVLIVGSPGVGLGANAQTGLFGAVAGIISVIAWFAIVFTGRYPRGLWDLVMTYMRWRANVVTYVALLRDEYPPFGEGAYPVAFGVEYPERSSRWTVALRLILVIPQVVVLFFVMLVWLATAVIAWFAILFTGRFPKGLFLFGVGAMRWSLRVQAYLYLMRDEYPPFSIT